MPILLKTWVECTAKTPLPRRRARGGGLCGFRGAAERVPAGSPKTGRCTAVRDRCGHGKRRKRTAAGEFQQREKPQAAKQDKAAGVVRAPRRSHLPAVRAVSGIYEGVVERAKIAPVGSQFEKSQTFQGKQWGCTKKVHVKRKKQQMQRWVKNSEFTEKSSVQGENLARCLLKNPCFTAPGTQLESG